MATIEDATLKKITGDFADEAPEAGYRAAANTLVLSVRQKFTDQLAARKDVDGAAFIESVPGKILLNESVFGFVLAAALEIIPSTSLQDVRKRLAYNMRVQSYQALGQEIAALSGLLNTEVAKLLSADFLAMPRIAVTKTADGKGSAATQGQSQTGDVKA